MNTSRRPLARLSPFGITYLHRQSPYMVAWWSAVLPGFGHYLLNKYTRATLLTLAEVVLNTLAHVNEAMVYSFCGRFAEAKAVLEPRWMSAYILLYLVSIWDSYRSALTQNKLCELADAADEPLPSVKLYASEVQYLVPKNPLITALFSFLFPGMGQLHNHRYGLAFYGMLWWVVYLSLSHAFEAMTELLLGRWEEANRVLQPHWLLFMPSVLGGAIYQGYITTIEHNRLFRLEQRQYLQGRYRHSDVRLFGSGEAGP